MKKTIRDRKKIKNTQIYQLAANLNAVVEQFDATSQPRWFSSGLKTKNFK